MIVSTALALLHFLTEADTISARIYHIDHRISAHDCGRLLPYDNISDLTFNTQFTIESLYGGDLQSSDLIIKSVVNLLNEQVTILPNNCTSFREATHCHRNRCNTGFSKKLKSRDNLNLRRKFLHASFGLFLATLHHNIHREIFLPFMALSSIIILFVELLRYNTRGCECLHNFLFFLFGRSLRKHEMEGNFTGAFYYFLGIGLTSYLFSPTAAGLGICQLALADPSASYFGRMTRDVHWSRISDGLYGLGRNKGFLGFAGGALFCLPFNYYIISIANYQLGEILPGGTRNIITASLALGVAGAFADLLVPTPPFTLPKRLFGLTLPPFHIDDNLLVPIVSAYACTKLFHALSWSSNKLILAKYILF